MDAVSFHILHKKNQKRMRPFAKAGEGGQEQALARPAEEKFK